MGTVALNFKKECEKQQLGVKDVVVENILTLHQGAQAPSTTSQKNRPKPKATRRSKPVKHALPLKPKRQKENKQVQPPSMQIMKLVKKVAREDFPSEVSDGINYDPSSEDDYRTIFTPKGSRLSCAPPLKFEDPPIPIEEEINKDADVEDGNVDFCQICKASGGLICCDHCPRAFHEKCLNMKKSDLPEKWECPKCVEDGEVQKGDKILESKYFEKLVPIYGNLEKDERDSQMFWQKITIVSIAVDIIDRLLENDFGYLFAEPVSVKEVPDYRKTIKKPMDLGTIKNNIVKGVYVKKLPHLNYNDGTSMERIALEVLKDIELVWHNCFLYNRDGKYSMMELSNVFLISDSFLTQINIVYWVERNYERYIFP